MSLQIHRAERADRLVEALADRLTEPLPDPFSTEIVAVPTRGVERWLAQRLSHRLGNTPGRGDGICAGIAFPSLHRLVATAVGLDDEHLDPWRPDRAVWPLLAVIDECRGQPWAALLGHYLDGGGKGGGRRWRTARRLAELFSRYAADRPAMIRHWVAGRDLDATGAPLPADRAWQAELWRRLRDRLGVPGPPDQLAAALDALAADPARVPLPDRLSIFGATRLDADHRAVVATLARHREVHLWLPHASPGSWDSLAAQLRSEPAELGPRAGDPTAALVRHRLLGYLGRDSRELQLALYASGSVAVDRHYRGAGAPPSTLLGRLQADLAADAEPEATPPPLDPADRSVRVHACYGPDRQVEVLREVLVGLLADDPTLEPRDIVVMCPDIERFAPLISAAFGLDAEEDRAEHPGHRLRVRLADRALRQLNPLLSVLSRVLDLADARLTASDVCDLAASTPVARRFGFTEDDTERLRHLVHQAGVRWGLDGPHRTAYGLDSFGQNTWAAGLDRLLLGVAMDEEGDHFIGTVLPLDDVDSSDVDLIGRLTELVRRLGRYADAAAAPRPVADWLALSRRVIDGLTATTTAESWQVNHAYAELARLTQAAGYGDGDGDGDSGVEVELGLAEVRALLGDTLRGRPSRANFRTGTLTMCTMHPMRSVPHRVVCLLGVDDGVFPRRPAPNGDDLMAAQEWIGDRDPRSEDRQLLLDAVMAAEEQLVVVYGGADPRTGATRPPAVPIGELLDALDRTVTSPDDRPVRAHLIRRHPLQPFDPSNFTATPFSFDRAALRGAQAAAAMRLPADPAPAIGPLRAVQLPEIISLTDLVRFLAHPARALLRTRGIWLGGRDDEDGGADELEVELNGLQSWAIGERLLDRRLRGSDLERLAAAEWRRGSLPPQAFGNQALDRVLQTVREIVELTLPFRTGEPTSRDVRVAAGDHWVAGTLQPLYASTGDGDELGTLLRVSYSRLAAKHRLGTWLELLALTAGCPEQRWRAVTVGKGGRSILGPVDPGWARLVLADLVQLYLIGLGEPLPLAPATSAEYARIRYRDSSVQTLIGKIEREWRWERDASWAVFLGPDPALDTLLAEPSRPAEERGTLVEPTRFGTLARRVFHPLLSSEDLT